MLGDNQILKSDEPATQMISEKKPSKDPNPKEKQCRYCSSNIDCSASVCRECSRDQRWYLNYFRIDHIGLVIALIMIVIASQQLKEVRQQRIAAGQAFDRAQQAENAAIRVAENLGRVQATVENQQKSIDVIAERAKQAFAEIQAAQKLSLQTKSQVEKAEGLLRKAEASANQIQTTVDFNLLLTKARNDDRQAFDQILKIAEEKGPFWKTAYDVALQIAMEVNPFVSVRVDPEVPWETYAADLNLDQMENLLKIYPSLPSFFRPSFIGQIWLQERFSKQKRMDFLYEVIKSDTSLRALHRACVVMNIEAKINKNILLAKQYLQWYQANRSKYDGSK